MLSTAYWWWFSESNKACFKWAALPIIQDAAACWCSTKKQKKFNDFIIHTPAKSN